LEKTCERAYYVNKTVNLIQRLENRISQLEAINLVNTKVIFPTTQGGNYPVFDLIIDDLKKRIEKISS